MHLLRIPLGLTLTLPLAAGLATDYENERILRIETLTTLEMETVDFSMERNGEAVEASSGSDAMSEESRKVVQFDKCLATEEGQPTKVRRTFDSLEGTLSATFGDREMDRESDCPLEGVSVEFTQDGGDVSAEIIEGDADEELLQGHSLALAIDALLPEDEVDEGDSWELESDAIARALGLDVAPLLFRRSEEGGGGGGGGGGRRRGRMGGGGALASFVHVEWEGEASLSSDSVDRDGVACVAIELKIEGSGEIPEPEGGFGRGRDRAPRAASLPGSPRAANENSITVEMEGTLYFALESKRPLSLALRGEVGTLREMERESDEFSMSMSTSREGEFEYEVTISEEKE